MAFAKSRGGRSVNNTLFDRLLYEEESTTLDFKREQYRFAKASDEEKSELLKDILGFANAWRRSEAYILIGVADVRGGRANLLGISSADHLDDHSLQQFVNNLTNRPIRFHYEAFGFEGKQVGIIRIEEQNRPIFLKKDYGKLRKGEVYVRRGSSTDPTKPADPDEIAQMGIAFSSGIGKASLSVEFAEANRDQTLGDNIQWTAEYCQMPTEDEIPKYGERPRFAPVKLPGGRVFQMPDIDALTFRDRLNSNYYLELANYTFFTKLIRKLRFVVSNTGEVPASDVMLEILAPMGMGYGIFDYNDVPRVPELKESFGSVASSKIMKLRPAFRPSGYVGIEKTDDQTKIRIECGSLQPGRKVWTDTFFMGIVSTGKVELRGYLFAANLSQPQEFVLNINAIITKTAMTVDELMKLEAPREVD
jgi:hypothetical protein